MGLVFLRHAYSRYLGVKDDVEANLPKRGGKTRALSKEDFSQKSAIFFQPKAELDHLVALPHNEDRAAIAANDRILPPGHHEVGGMSKTPRWLPRIPANMENSNHRLEKPTATGTMAWCQALTERGCCLTLRNLGKVQPRVAQMSRVLPIGVATYRIVKRLLKELKGQLPSPDEIAQTIMKHVLPVDLQIGNLHRMNSNPSQVCDRLLPRLMNGETGA